MMQWLASVTDVHEALQVLDAGADIVDLKNPRQGALGALPLPVITGIARQVNGIRPVSATVGDLPMMPARLSEAVLQTAAAGVDIVKIGMFGHEGHAACIHAMRPLTARGIRIVAVLFADVAPDFSLLPQLAQAGFHGVMLDTALKDGRGLRDHCTDEDLRAFVEAAQSLNLLTGLAGSLTIEDVRPLSGFAADYLGFRSALCQNSDRKTSIDRGKLMQLKEVLHSCNTHSKVPV